MTSSIIMIETKARIQIDFFINFKVVKFNESTNLTCQYNPSDQIMSDYIGLWPTRSVDSVIGGDFSEFQPDQIVTC